MHNKEWLEFGPFTIFDVETTGRSPKRDRIIEIAGIRIDKNGNKSHYHSLVNPECNIPLSISKIHGITINMVKNKRTFKYIGKEFLDFSKGSILVAHNAIFDLSFLQESLQRYKLPLWNGKTIDSIKIIKNAYPGLKSYALQKLRETLNIKLENLTPHRAFSDVELTLEIFNRAMEKLIS